MSEIFLLLDRGFCAILALRIVPPATFRVPWAFFFPIRLLKSDWFRHIRILIAVPLLKILVSPALRFRLETKNGNDMIKNCIVLSSG
jgi:hypothetical protein